MVFLTHTLHKLTKTQFTALLHTMSIFYDKILIMNDKIKYWIELSDYDLDTAEAMLHSKRYLYVAFMCHQTIEKIIKAYYVKNQKTQAPYKHSLSYLSKATDLYSQFSVEQQDFLDILEPLNIEARYPTYKERLLKSLTQNKSETIFIQTKELQQWIKNKLLK